MNTLRIRSRPDQNVIWPTVEDQVQAIQLGDEGLRCEMIQRYQPLIRKFVSKTCRRYVDHTMDEYSIGLAAFNEAIDQFQASRKICFLSFAYVVVRRRVIDFLRKEANQKKMVFFGQLEGREQNNRKEESLPELKESIQSFEMTRQNEMLADEIFEYKERLKDYNITFKHVIKQCPKQIDARQRAVAVAKTLAGNEQLSHYLQTKKKLPLKDLLDQVSCSKKTVERHRMYIIAVALVYLESFSKLKAFVRF